MNTDDPSPSSATPRTLADRLAAARRARFIGRREELAAFARMLEPGHHAPVMFVRGPGGIGKTTLLREFAELAEARGRIVVTLDGRNVEPIPERFEQGFLDALGGLDDTVPDGLVLLVDTFEAVAPLEHWLRDQFLPRLPADAVVVLAGRTAADTRWRSDPGWAELATQRVLAHLSPDEACAYLDARGVPHEQRRRAVELAHGHPLALSLLADALRASRTQVLDSPGERLPLMRTLLERYAEDMPTPEHRTAFGTLILARSTSESLLADLVSPQQAEGLYDWLRRLPFVEEGPHGLLPHDLVREAFEADWTARDAPRVEAVRNGIIRHLNARIHRLGDDERYRFTRDWMFLLRKHPMVGPFFDWSADFDVLYCDELREGDEEALVALTADLLGVQNAAIARHWVRRQPEAVHITRDQEGRLCGYGLSVDLALVEEADLQVDPALRLAVDHIHRHAPMRAGDLGLIGRFVLHQGSRMPPNPTFSHGSLAMLVKFLTQVRLAWTLMFFPDADLLLPLFNGMKDYHWQHRLRELDFEADGLRFGCYGRDWRAEPNPAWLACTQQDHHHHDRPRHAAEEEALSRVAFVDAVREALRHYTRTDRLVTSALLRCAFLRHEPSVEGLRSALSQAVHALAGHPKEEKFFHALRLTYLDPGASQEKVAEELGLPFNTYRYQLARGIDRVVESLWQRELGAGQQARSLS
ncbi:MAG: hypothetical protein EPO01_05025 [Aquabacterium sp.]|nr:MAG: hypothetical protein EPO01_05025 [Aquabacterium sp.]